MTINSVQPFTTPLQKNQIQIERLSQEEIIKIATKRPVNEVKKAKNKALFTIFATIPFVDSALRTTLQKGSLYKKTKNFASNYAKWGGIFAIGLGILGIKKAITQNSEKMKNFDQKYPVFGFLVDMGVMFGALTMAQKNGLKLGKVIQNKYPDAIKALNTNIKKPLIKVLNNTTINRKYVKAFDNFMTNNPKIKTATTIASLVVPPAIAVGAIIKNNQIANAATKEAIQNYQYLNAINNVLPEKADNTVDKA